MKVKEFTDMLGSFNSIVVCIEKKGQVVAFDDIVRSEDGSYDVKVQLELTSKGEGLYTIDEINDMAVVGVTTATAGDVVRLWLDV